jgi:hypothetical protein
VKLKRKIVFSLILFITLVCSGISVIEDKDSKGRIYRKSTYLDGKLQAQEETKYLGSSLKPSTKIFKILRGTRLIPIREEGYFYKNQALRSIKYYIYSINTKILSGKINYFYNNSLPKRIEYYSITDINRKKIFRSGIEIYSYNDHRLEQRRIIEYEYKPESNKTMQLSQYVLFYKNNKGISMHTWILDKKSNNIIKNEENNLNMITEMIKNIEKSLRERAKGIKLTNK